MLGIPNPAGPAATPTFGATDRARNQCTSRRSTLSSDYRTAILCSAIGGGAVILLVLVILVSHGLRSLPRSDGDKAGDSVAGQLQAVLLPPEDWISLPQTEWPQMVLTNQADFNGHTSLEGASSFLIKTEDGRVLAATARHLIGDAGGVEPEIRVNQLTRKIRSWRMFPRTMPTKYVEAESVAVDGLDNPFLDWLLLTIRNRESLPAYPLRLRRNPVQVGETVYLLGCPYAERDCKQNVYVGTITYRAGDMFRYDIRPPVDIRGFSGAPIIDERGHVVGVITVWFNPKMRGNNFLEAGGEDVKTIYDLLHAG